MYTFLVEIDNKRDNRSQSVNNSRELWWIGKVVMMSFK